MQAERLEDSNGGDSDLLTHDFPGLISRGGEQRRRILIQQKRCVALFPQNTRGATGADGALQGLSDRLGFSGFR